MSTKHFIICFRLGPSSESEMRVLFLSLRSSAVIGEDVRSLTDGCLKYLNSSKYSMNIYLLIVSNIRREMISVWRDARP